jgi:hypothetical protein
MSHQTPCDEIKERAGAGALGLLGRGHPGLLSFVVLFVVVK